MVLIRFSTPTGAAFGLLRDGQVYALDGEPYSDNWAQNADKDHFVGSIDEVELLSPCAPSKVVAVGRNYADHAAEFGNVVPDEPLLFFKPPSAVIGPDDNILLPPQSERVEHEAELCLVIGRRCRRVSVEEAWSCVFGVTCGNDVTARDIQRNDRQWTRGKGFDTSAPLGPWVVTGLPAETVSSLSIRCKVNGICRQDGQTKDMVYSPSELVSFISEMITLEPGDVVMTGTPAGVGPLEPGDRVAVTIEAIGTLSNPVKAG